MDSLVNEKEEEKNCALSQDARPVHIEKYLPKMNMANLDCAARVMEEEAHALWLTAKTLQ